MLRHYLPDILITFIMIPLLTLLLLAPIIIPNGIPFYGDETYYQHCPNSFYSASSISPFLWVSARGSLPIYFTLFSYNIPLAFSIGLFGQEFAIKILITVLASLPSILTYFALNILAKEWLLLDGKKEIRLFALSGSLLTLLSFTNWGLLGAGTASAWALIMLPISFALLVRYLRSGSTKHLLLLGLCSLFAIANPSWMYLMIIMGLTYLVI
jgi:hypothetical protein